MENHLVPIFVFGIVTFVFGILVMPYYITFLVNFRLGKQIREEATIGKASIFAMLHKDKKGTPTMGGAIILALVFFMVIISIGLQKFGYINNSLLNQKETYLTLFTLFTVGFLGAIDDYMNIKGLGRTKGLSARFKMLWLIVFATTGALWFYYKLGWDNSLIDPVTGEAIIRALSIPLFGDYEIGLFFIPLFIFIIIFGANSVNITDGLDGLAGGLLLFSYSVYAYITYENGLFLLSTLCVTIIGALVAFLWFNIKPAKFYMGDVGSLALGANLGIMAMITNTLFVLAIIGAIFIFELVSVVIQLTSKKLRNGKKVFKVAPFHHHLEAIGWSEETVVFRFWLIGILLSAIGIIVYNIS